jgi:hypothetical protein
MSRQSCKDYSAAKLWLRRLLPKLLRCPVFMKSLGWLDLLSNRVQLGPHEKKADTRSASYLFKHLKFNAMLKIILRHSLFSQNTEAGYFLKNNNAGCPYRASGPKRSPPTTSSGQHTISHKSMVSGPLAKPGVVNLLLVLCRCTFRMHLKHTAISQYHSGLISRGDKISAAHPKIILEFIFSILPISAPTDQVNC